MNRAGYVRSIGFDICSHVGWDSVHASDRAITRTTHEALRMYEAGTSVGCGSVVAPVAWHVTSLPRMHVAGTWS